MKSSRAYITDYIADPDIETEILGKELSHIKHERVEVLIVWHEHINTGYIDQFPNLKGIIRYGVGYDNIDIDYSRSKNIDVCNTPDYGTDEVSDTAIAMIMNIARGVSRYDAMCRAYAEGWQENTLGEIRRTSDYKLGVIGAGRIGGGVLLKAKMLRLQTLMYDPYTPSGHEKMLDAVRVDSLEELLAESDIVSIHTPLTEETRGLVDQWFVSKMKQGASLVNTARGKIVDDIDAFYMPLKQNHLNCVALDVLPDEPPGDSQLVAAWRNREDWLDGRLIINPHSAYYSAQAYFEMRHKAASNAMRILAGQKPLNIVNG